MEVQVSKENICVNKLVAEKKELIFISGDMIVPDSKPDVLNTINVTGNVCVYKKDISDNKVKFEGNLNTYIMYFPDSKEDKLRALNCNLDFSESISVPGAKEGMMLCTKCIVKDIECKVINGRKISVKAGIEFHIKMYSNEEIQIINSINNIQDVQTLYKNFNVNSLVGEGKTCVYAKDTFNISQNDELAEILKVDIRLVDKDIKLSYNKVLAKAELEVKMMYLTEDNRMGRVFGKIPVVGFIDIQNISEDNICDIDYNIKNMIIRPNPIEEHSVYVEVEVEQSCMAFEKKELNIIEDLYSPTSRLEFSQKRIVSISDKAERIESILIQENIQITEMEEKNILDIEPSVSLVNTQILDNKIIYTGDININLILDNEGNINSRNIKLPFEFIVDNVDKVTNINIENEITIKNSEIKIQSKEEAQCKIELEVFIKTSKNVNMNIIDNIESFEEENEEDYNSLIIYIVQQRDSLWKIAKKFNSTVEIISNMNGIENSDFIDVGQKIYIPKFNYVKSKNVEI